MKNKGYILPLIVFLLWGFITLNPSGSNTFCVNQNKKILQDFKFALAPVTLKKDSTFFSYFNQTFRWNKCANDVCLFQVDKRSETFICSANDYFSELKNQQVTFMEVNPIASQMLIITTDFSQKNNLHIISIPSCKIVLTIKEVNAALWLNNSHIVYHKNKDLMVTNIPYNLTRTTKKLSDYPGEVSLFKNKSNNILLSINDIDTQHTLLVDNNGNALNIPIFKNSHQVQYKLDKIEANWVCTIQNYGDFHQLLTTQGDITNPTTNWETVIATKDKTYLEQIKSYDTGLIVKGFKNGNNFIITYNSDLSKKTYIKFDESLYQVDLNDQPLLKDFLLQVSNRNNGLVSFRYNLITKETVPVDNTSERFSPKYFDLTQLEANDIKNQPLITVINRVNVKKSIDAVVIKVVGEPKLQIRDHISSNEIALLEEGYALALVHVLPPQIGFISTTNINSQLENSNLLLLNGIHNIIKEFPLSKLYAIAQYKGCNLLINHSVNHPNLFEAIVLINPILQNKYTEMQQQPIANATPKEKKYIETQKWEDPLIQIISQDFPAMLFVSNTPPNEHTVAVYNKLGVTNTGNNQLYYFTNYLPPAFNATENLITAFLNDKL